MWQEKQEKKFGMKNTQKPPKVFIDTSSLLAGLNSPLGASGIIIALFKTKKIQAVISLNVIEEAKRAIARKLPLLKIPFFDFLISNPIIINNISKRDIRKTRKMLDTEDTPILAVAIKAKVRYLITLDKEFKRKATPQEKCKILLPGEFLTEYREGEKNEIC